MPAYGRRGLSINILFVCWTRSARESILFIKSTDHLAKVNVTTVLGSSPLVSFLLLVFRPLFFIVQRLFLGRRVNLLKRLRAILGCDFLGSHLFFLKSRRSRTLKLNRFERVGARFWRQAM
ncbi:hypothetical protein L596_030140 [Steinernema carpocapsae]|uniref:Uncharacterized protein n=1 Tax=Steinernema carpocapsae TaxID=34508 RepID=A0A4U5LRU6_STECR|nr:hypothetical protein L596_030140 [Steinernema carpocapsae]